MQEAVLIYALCDPITGCIRYVGKTIRRNKRLREHIRDKKKSHKSAWISSLKERGVLPTLEVLETLSFCSDQDWKDAEKFWISYLRFLGCKLVNLENGGDGIGTVAQETKEKLRAIRLGRKLSDAEREAISNGKIGVPRPDISAILKGRKRPPRDPAWSAKISAAKKGKALPPHVGMAAVAATKGKRMTMDQIESRKIASGMSDQERAEQSRRASLARWAKIRIPIQ